MLKRLVHQTPALNRIRKTIRFAQRIPPRDYTSAKARAAIRVRPNTRLDYARLAALHDLAHTAPEGAFVECGVWKGGSAAMMLLADTSREAWLFDSWEGLPEPGPGDIAAGGHRRAKGWNYADEQDVVDLLFGRFGLSQQRVHLVRGWFDATLPATRDRIGPIAVLHLDCDWYESMMVALGQLYELVALGGWIVVDDYFHWEGAAKAVDEFLAGQRIELVRVGVAAHWQKPHLTVSSPAMP